MSALSARIFIPWLLLHLVIASDSLLDAVHGTTTVSSVQNYHGLSIVDDKQAGPPTPHGDLQPEGTHVFDHHVRLLTASNTTHIYSAAVSQPSASSPPLTPAGLSAVNCSLSGQTIAIDAVTANGTLISASILWNADAAVFILSNFSDGAVDYPAVSYDVPLQPDTGQLNASTRDATGTNSSSLVPLGWSGGVTVISTKAFPGTTVYTARVSAALSVNATYIANRGWSIVGAASNYSAVAVGLPQLEQLVADDASAAVSVACALNVSLPNVFSVRLTHVVAMFMNAYLQPPSTPAEILCELQTSCAACVAVQGCGFCEGVCVPESSTGTGPAAGEGSCPTGLWGHNSTACRAIYPSATPTTSPTSTPSNTASTTQTPSSTSSPTTSLTSTPSHTASNTGTPSRTVSQTQSGTVTSSETPSLSGTTSSTQTSSFSPSQTDTQSATSSATASQTATTTTTVSSTGSPSRSPPVTPSASHTACTTANPGLCAATTCAACNAQAGCGWCTTGVCMVAAAGGGGPNTTFGTCTGGLW